MESAPPEKSASRPEKSGAQLASRLVVRNADGLNLDGRFVVFDFPRDFCVDLDEIGSDIWHRLEHPVRVDALVSEFSGKYEGDPAAIAADVTEFLERLIAAGAVRVLDAVE